jgi:hypothetical protein
MIESPTRCSRMRTGAEPSHPVAGTVLAQGNGHVSLPLSANAILSMPTFRKTSRGK